MIDRVDALGFSGVACISLGSAWIYPPLGVIVLGALLLSGALIASRRTNNKGDQ